MQASKKLLCLSSLLFTLLSVILVTPLHAEAGEHPLKGQTLEMSVLGPADWLPSRLSMLMSPEFVAYAKERYGYDVNFTFIEAPIPEWYQQVTNALEARSQDAHLMIIDRQWLGALAEQNWIVNAEDLIEAYPELHIE